MLRSDWQPGQPGGQLPDSDGQAAQSDGRAKPVDGQQQFWIGQLQQPRQAQYSLRDEAEVRSHRVSDSAYVATAARGAALHQTRPSAPSRWSSSSHEEAQSGKAGSGGGAGRQMPRLQSELGGSTVMSLLVEHPESSGQAAYSSWATSQSLCQQSNDRRGVRKETAAPVLHEADSASMVDLMPVVPGTDGRMGATEGGTVGATRQTRHAEGQGAKEGSQTWRADKMDLKGRSFGQAPGTIGFKHHAEVPKGNVVHVAKGMGNAVQVTKGMGPTSSGPQRQKLLHNRFALFDSDSSSTSSEDEELGQVLAMLSSHSHTGAPVTYIRYGDSKASLHYLHTRACLV